MEILDALFIYSTRFTKEFDRHTRLHDHGDNVGEIHYFLCDDGNFINGDTCLKIHSGMICYTPANVLHQIQASSPHSSIYYYAITFKIHKDETTLHRLFSDLDYHKGYFLEQEYRLGFERIVEEHAKQSIIAENRFLSFLLEVQLKACSANIPLKDSSSRMERIFKYMHENLRQNISLDELAACIGVSKNYLCKYFKDYTGSSPLYYFQGLKFTVAKQMLIKTDSSVKEIATELQFYDEFHFSHQFHKRFKISPRDYRRRGMSSTNSVSF